MWLRVVGPQKDSHLITLGERDAQGRVRSRAHEGVVDRVRRWLLKAEGLAGVPKQRGSLWHAFRRGWATARKHFPPKDTVAAGRWSSTKTLLRCYQQADEATMLAVVLGGAELRDRRAQ